MADFYSFRRFIEALRAVQPHLIKVLGTEWFEFAQKLIHILDRIAAAKRDNTEHKIPDYMFEIITLGQASKAQAIFRVLIIRAQLRVEDFESDGVVQDTNGLRYASKYLLISLERDIKRGSGDLEVIRSSEQLGSAEIAYPRYLNVGLFQEKESSFFSIVQPLVRSRTYRLGVNIGRFWGLENPDYPFPAELLGAELSQGQAVLLDVIPRSLDINFVPSHHELSLSPQGDTDFIFFDLKLLRDGRLAVDVDLMYHGHLLQSRRLETEVVNSITVSEISTVWPPQNSYITFTRSNLLDPNELEPLATNPRHLTIVAERDLNFNRIGLRFYDAGGETLGFQQSELSDVNLSRAMEAARKQLADTMQAYSGGVGSTRELLERHLGQLADVGRRFYLRLLPGFTGNEQPKDNGQRLIVDIPPGSLIQVAPLSTELGVPWELLYERPIESFREGRVKLCTTFQEHGPLLADCPHAFDPTTVCPHGFWGYRYIIEQLPGRVVPNGTVLTHSLPMVISNKLPLTLATIVFLGFPRLNEHLGNLRNLAPKERLSLTQATSLQAVRILLAQNQAPADLIYFYTHGGHDAFGSPYLEIGAGEYIKEIDLDAWRVNLDHQPLVILNACDSAGYSPASYENLVKFFCDHGAAGVIGTQCEIKESLADAFIGQFLRRFLMRLPAGQAIYDARQVLLRQHLDPRGLVYSLFASAEVRLAEAVLV